MCVRDVHGVIRCQQDEWLRHIHNNAGLVTPDGMPLVWLARMSGFRHAARVYGPDLMLAFCERSAGNGHRHFFYGGATGTPERLAEKLKSRFPGLTVVGTYSPPFRPLAPEEDDAIVRLMNLSSADVVWVGLSTPKQEIWMWEHVGKVKAPVLIGVGAAFDFHAGIKKQAPRWLQRSGLEWLFRLATEPKRLWRRYLWVVPSFLFLSSLQLMGLKKYSIDD